MIPVYVRFPSCWNHYSYYKTPSDTDNMWKRFLCLCVKEAFTFWCWMFITIAWKNKKRYFVGFEKILSGWDVLSPDSSPNILTSSKTASKRGQGFFSECVRNMNIYLWCWLIFIRREKSFCSIWTNFEWVKCYRVLTIDSVAVCASFFDRSDELTKMEEAQIELVYVTDRIICKL